MENGNRVPFAEMGDKEKFFRKTKFWVILFSALVAVTMSVIFYKTVIQQSMTTEEVARSVQVVWQDTIWVDKKTLPGETTIVPSISFKVKNNGQKPLQYVYFTCIFQYSDSGENLSDGFTPALQNPLEVGQVSEEIFIKGYYGYKASSKEAFIRNIASWKNIKAKLFARTKNSENALLGIFPVAKKIQGVNVVYGTDTEITTTPKKE